ncbi:hypothetical protein [Neisseria iguanae]|uniref:hypothetical protein n=1 Tax=Neisseria iguanae TaxID=90242 RepID=UPI0014754B94|nr:hypothetical protein [Neisseria iguanae]
MNRITAMQLVRAVIKRYPSHGYDGLNAEIISKSANISPKHTKRCFLTKTITSKSWYKNSMAARMAVGYRK